MKIEILPDSFDLDREVTKAIAVGRTDNLKVIEAIAERYPDAKFYRRGDNQTFGASQIACAIKEDIDPR